MPETTQEKAAHQATTHQSSPQQDTTQQNSPQQNTPQQATTHQSSPQQNTPHQNTPQQAILKKIKEKLLSLGVSDVGFCKVKDGVGGLNNAVSIVVRLSDAIIDEISHKPTHTYFNHYRTVNAFIDQCLLQTGVILQQGGYRYITVAASQSINDEGWNYQGRYSHKKAATLAGLGSIGNSCLFLHKDFGARVRLGTVFTDCEFGVANQRQPSPCTHCNICKDNCPSGAILGKAWSEDIKREEFFCAELCSEYMKKAFKNIGRGAVCGICIRHCPHR